MVQILWYNFGMSKTEVIKIRCTPEERATLEIEGMTLAAAIRQKLFGEQGIPIQGLITPENVRAKASALPKKALSKHLEEKLSALDVSKPSSSEVVQGITMSMAEMKALRQARMKK